MSVFSREDRRDRLEAARAIGTAVSLFPPFRGRRAILAAHRAARVDVIGERVSVKIGGTTYTGSPDILWTEPR